MADDPDNIVLVYLRRLDERTARMEADIQDLKTAVSGVVQIMAAQENRLNRMDGELTRIRKRLDLVDA